MVTDEPKKTYRVLLRACRAPFALVEVRSRLRHIGADLISIEARGGKSSDEILVQFELSTSHLLPRTLERVEEIPGVAVFAAVELPGEPNRSCT